MTLVNARWPDRLTPSQCTWGRARNDVVFSNPYSHAVTGVVVRGRPLWTARLTWRLPPSSRLAELRYWLDALDGVRGSVQLWDFAHPYPAALHTYSASDNNARSLWTDGTGGQWWDWDGMPAHWSLGSTASVLTGAPAGAYTLPVSGLEPGRIAAVVGQYVQAGRRLYLAADGVTADAEGRAVIPLSSPLISTAAGGEVVRLAAAGCEMQLASQSWSADTSAGSGETTIAAEFIETVTDYA